MNSEQRIKILEEEVKVLKNDIKATLLDVRERVLAFENPFTQPPRRNGEFSLEESEERAQIVELEEDEPPPKVEKLCTEELEASQILVPDEELTSAHTANSQKEMHERHNSKNGNKVDLVTIAGLTQWAEQATMRIGKERVEALVEVLHMMGRLPSGFREALLKLLCLSPAEHADIHVTAKDYLAVLVQMENLLGQSTQSETALLSILSNDHGQGEVSYR